MRCSVGSLPPLPRRLPRWRWSRWRPGHGGAYTALALPATAARQILVPAALALALAAMRRPSPGLLATRWGRLARARGRASDVCDLPLDPVRRLPRSCAGRGAGAASARSMLVLAALVVPAGAVLVWLRAGDPRARPRSAPMRPSGRARSSSTPASCTARVDHFSLAPQVFGRSGAVAVAALCSFRSQRSRPSGAGPPTSSVARSPSSRSRSCPGCSPRSRTSSRSRSRGASRASYRSASPSPAAWASSPRCSARSRRRSRSSAAWSCSGSSRATSATPSSRAVPRGPRGLQSSAPSSRSSSGCGGPLCRGRPPAGLDPAAPADLRPRPARMVGVPGAPAEPAHARSGRRPPGRRSRRRHRLLGSRVELSDRRVRAGVRLQCPPGARRRHRAQPALCRREEWKSFNRTGSLADPRGCGARWIVIDRDRFDTRLDLPVAFSDGRFTLYRLHA